MSELHQFLPGTGRGTTRRVVEGGRGLTQPRAVRSAPSVSGFAAATSPRVGRNFG